MAVPSPYDGPTPASLGRGPARDAARAADAGQVGQGDPRPGEVRRADLRAEVGRVPLHRLPGRRRGRAGQPQHQAADPLLPRGRRGDPGAAAGAVRARRRDLRRDRRPAGVRDAPGADPPRGVAGSTCWPRRRRPAYVAFDLLALGRRVVRRPPVRRAPGRAGGGAGRASDGPLLPDPDDRGPGRGRAVVQRVRGRRARRRGRQAARATYEQNARTMLKIKHERTADVRGGRLPRAQDLHPGAAAARQPAARPLRRRRAAARRRQRVLHREAPGRADRRSCSRWSCRSRTTRGDGGRSS